MVGCVETAKSIELPFRLWATEPRIRWGPGFPAGTGNFRRKCLNLALGVGLDFLVVRVV